MFDIGFWELIFISVIGLVVLGPERLPVAIRTVKNWISGVRKFSDTVKSELSEELRIHELHTNLKKAGQSNISNLSPEVAESLKSLQEAATMVKDADITALDSLLENATINQSLSLDSPSNNELNSASLKDESLVVHKDATKLAQK